MSEIVKCPLCGKEPGWHDFDVECYAPSAERKYFCCGVECKASAWNHYAAAMELANVEAWEAETDYVRAYLDDTLEDCAAWEEIVDTNIAAERAVFDARDRVLEVFK